MTDLGDVKEFWEAHVNNEYYTKLERASQPYFQEIETRRYRYHYHLPALFERIGGGEGLRLLEVGCGIGIDTVMLARAGFDVTAIDLTEAAVGVARQRARRLELDIDYRVGNCEQLGFDDEAFDVVYSFGVIHHTPDMQSAVGEIHRVLKPGGRAHIMIYSRFSLVNLVHVLGRVPYESPRNMKDHCPVVVRSSRRDAGRLFSAFRRVSVHADYPFTYGMRCVSRMVPRCVQRALGRVIGWHLMIEAVK